MTDDDGIDIAQQRFLQSTQDDTLLERSGLTLLGAGPLPAQRKLETFNCPANVHEVEFLSDELICACPMTGQPDIYRLRIKYKPDQVVLESKSLKLYLWTFGNEQMFAEVLAERIARDVQEATRAISVDVELVQNMRGGIVTIVRAKEGR